MSKPFTFTLLVILFAMANVCIGYIMNSSLASFYPALVAGVSLCIVGCFFCIIRLAEND